MILHMKTYIAPSNSTKYFYPRMESLSQLFYSNLPRKQRKLLGPRFDGLVVHCTFRGAPCGEGDFRHFLHPTLINCYTFDPKKTLETLQSNDLLIGPQNGLSLILRSEPNPNVWYEVRDKTANSDSIRVAIHPHGTVPFVMNKGVNLEAGKSTSISMMMKMYDRLGSPYKECHKKETFEIDSREFLRTSSSCRELCIVDAIRQDCNCTSTFFEDISISEHEYCLTFHNDYDLVTLNTRAKCESEFITLLPADLDCSHCIWDCNQIDYDTQIAFADWPHENKIENFLYTYITSEYDCNSTLMQYYKALQNAADLELNPCNESEITDESKQPFSMVSLANVLRSDEELFQFARDDFAEVYEYAMGVPRMYYEQNYQEMLNKMWVKNSFYRLNVYFRESSVEQHSQVASFSLADLWSGVGGIFGLWLGISVMTIIEMFSFLIHFIVKFFKSESSVNKIDVKTFDAAHEK